MTRPCTGETWEFKSVLIKPALGSQLLIFGKWTSKCTKVRAISMLRWKHSRNINDTSCADGWQDKNSVGKLQNATKDSLMHLWRPLSSLALIFYILSMAASKIVLSRKVSFYIEPLPYRFLSVSLAWCRASITRTKNTREREINECGGAEFDFLRLCAVSVRITINVYSAREESSGWRGDVHFVITTVESETAI